LIGPLFGVVAVVLGIVALVRANHRPAEYGGRRAAITGICCGGASFLIVLPLTITVLLPSLSRARELAKRAVCAANLRGIGQGCLIYANDNYGWFPPDLQELIDAGHITPGELQCPSEANPSTLVSDFIYVPGLQRTVPSDWILAYEDPVNHHGEGGHVLYVGFSVEFLEEPAFSAELERVRWEIEESEHGEHPWYRAQPLEVP
jgi:hypothetical protein